MLFLKLCTVYADSKVKTLFSRFINCWRAAFSFEQKWKFKILLLQFHPKYLTEQMPYFADKQNVIASSWSPRESWTTVSYWDFTSKPLEMLKRFCHGILVSHMYQKMPLIDQQVLMVINLLSRTILLLALQMIVLFSI